MTDPVPAMARVVREDPDEPAVLLVCPSNGPPLRFLLTLAGKCVLMEDVTASVAEDVRRAVGAATPAREPAASQPPAAS